MFKLNFIKKSKVAVIGMGYVGLPLAIEIQKKIFTVGYDKNKTRINNLKKNKNLNNEININKLRSAKKLLFSNNEKDLSDCNIFILTVPTPIKKKSKKPNLVYLLSASKIVGKNIKKNDIVIFESTVFPGTTEHICVPLIERVSGLKFNQDFYVGYSPERVNPNDKKNTLNNITKITSGSNVNTSKFVDEFYKTILKTKTFKAKSIQVAEASKLFENVQRDVNIALVNEFSTYLNKININSRYVLDAASTKWNFMNVKPGLTGGHCIGVDTYYYIHNAIQNKIYPKIAINSRKVNENLVNILIARLKKLLKSRNTKIKNCKVLILGFAYKENSSDFRETQIVQLKNKLEKNGFITQTVDSRVDSFLVKKQFNINIIKTLPNTKSKYHVIILAVPHKEFLDKGISFFKKLVKPKGVIFDLKSVLNVNKTDLRL